MKRDLQSKIPSPTHVFILVMSFGGATCKVNGWVDDFCCNILGYHRPRGELFTCRIRHSRELYKEISKANDTLQTCGQIPVPDSLSLANHAFG